MALAVHDSLLQVGAKNHVEMRTTLVRTGAKVVVKYLDGFCNPRDFWEIFMIFLNFVHGHEESLEMNQKNFKN